MYPYGDSNLDIVYGHTHLGCFSSHVWHTECSSVVRLQQAEVGAIVYH
jgi:hypothetical protein